MAQHPDDDNPFAQVRDFVIVYGAPEEELVRHLAEAIRTAGLSSWSIHHASCTAWVISAGGPLWEETLRAGRVCILVYSESDAPGNPAFRDLNFVRSHLYLWAVESLHRGPLIVLVVNGTWPLQLPGVTVIYARNRPATHLHNDIVAAAGPHLIHARTSEAAFGVLGRMVKTGIQSVQQREGKVLLVFGPERPKDFATAVANIERTMLARLRDQIRSAVAASGWLGVFGEDLVAIGEGSERNLNPALKERLFAKSVLAVVIIVESPGSIAEVSLMSQYAEICSKMILVVNREHAGGFVAKGPVAEALRQGAIVVDYVRKDLDDGTVLALVTNTVQNKVETFLADAMRFGSREPPSE